MSASHDNFEYFDHPILNQTIVKRFSLESKGAKLLLVAIVASFVASD